MAEGPVFAKALGAQRSKRNSENDGSSKKFEASFFVVCVSPRWGVAGDQTKSSGRYCEGLPVPC